MARAEQTANARTRGPTCWPGSLGLLCTLLGCGSPVVTERPAPDGICVVTLALTEAALAHGELRQPLLPGDVTIAQVGPDRLFPGGRIVLLGNHLGGEEGELPVLRLQGQFTDLRGEQTEILAEIPGRVAQGGRRAEFPLDRELLDGWGLTGKEGAFSGQAALLVRVGEPLTSTQLPFALEFALVRQLSPQLSQLSLDSRPDQTLDIFPEDTLTLVASDLLLQGEGDVTLVLAADARRGDGARRVETYRLPVVAEARRDDGTVTFTAAAFGILTGEVSGEAHLRLTTLTGEVWESKPIAVHLRVQPPFISGFDPPAASRGQWVNISGRGFLPASPSGGTILRLDGKFYATGEAAPVELRRFELLPEAVVGNGVVRVPFRSETMTVTGKERILTGLTANPGQFLGTITPIVSWDSDEVEGIPYEGGFTISSTRQVVYIKYLPGFTISLNSTWGLKNVEREIRQQILSVVTRDYTGVNIHFTEERPADFLEYMVIEVGGPDPNGQDLFGLDNTSGEEGESPKDVGNLRLQEVIGGRNARNEEHGYLAYGGVFLESFRQFSTLLPNPISLASRRFDEIFEGVAPFLCGTSVEADEYPDGPRAAEIAEAIRVLGNLVGNTISHEVGHSLGLSLPHGPPDEFHNLFDTPNAMMDNGGARSFEERAEIDGQGPAVFVPENRAYLQEILPVAP
ncbi:MAG: hypothetical protein RBU45_19375 [Myxococcota bacterium]|jgi:hypothetical protein|nr:hypothetical protein [Myxococcota bacterium]